MSHCVEKSRDRVHSAHLGLFVYGERTRPPGDDTRQLASARHKRRSKPLRSTDGGFQARNAGYEGFVHCGLVGSPGFSNAVQPAADAIATAPGSPELRREGRCRSR